MGSAMPDGAPSVSRRRRWGSFFEDADPRFAASDECDASPTKSGAAAWEVGVRKKPRIAFTGEEYGFGYQATGEFIRRAREEPVSYGGVPRPKEREFDFRNYVISAPLRTKEQALMAVKQGAADFAVVPFYNPYSGYDIETLRGLGSLLTLMGVEQIEATDDLCLAVHESQLYDLIQSAHPGSGFSAMQRYFRKSRFWGPDDPLESGNRPGDEFSTPGGHYAGWLPCMQDQKLIRDRIDVVFAGPEAVRRCKSKLDGLRATGVSVQEIAQMTEPHRELARLARSTMSAGRLASTVYDPITNDVRHFSTIGAEAQNNKLFGMVLPHEVAMRSSDYIIVDHKFDDAPEEKTRFMLVETNPDASYMNNLNTFSRSSYWARRLTSISGGKHNQLARVTGSIALALGSVTAFCGLFGASSLPAAFSFAALAKWLPVLSAPAAMSGGLSLVLLGWLLVNHQGAGAKGVRVMLRFQRARSAASLGEVEEFLRKYCVRHSLVRIGEDSESDAPASTVLDIEFDPADFVFNPWTMLTRRLNGSVVNGALEKAFARWKSRNALVLAAMPFEDHQLPPLARRRRLDTIGKWMLDASVSAFASIFQQPWKILVVVALLVAAYGAWETVWRLSLL